MEKLVIISAIGILLTQLIIIAMVYEGVRETRVLRKLLKRDLETHQEWLFNQLYAIAPGKILKPEELEPQETHMPAEVIHPSRDPMNEFNGVKNDWFD